MRVAIDDIWLCSDCTVVACNGPEGIELENKAATMAGLESLGRNLVPDFESETGEGIREFSWHGCDCCHSPLGGSLHRFAILE